MSKTDEQQIDPTGDDTPATDDNNGSPAPDDKDVKNLVSARDRANEELRQAQEQIADLQAVVGSSEKEKAISAFLKEHKDDYPDVEAIDLGNAGDPDEFEEMAKTAQERMEKLRDKVRSEIEVSKDPVPLTLEEIQEKEKAIMEDDSITDKASAIFDLRQI